MPAARTVNLKLTMQRVPSVDEVAVGVAPSTFNIDVAEVIAGVQEARPRYRLATHDRHLIRRHDEVGRRDPGRGGGRR